MAGGTVGAVDADAIAMLVGQPVFTMSRDITLHMEDTTPLPLGTGTQGSGVLAVPMRVIVPGRSGCLARVCCAPDG